MSITIDVICYKSKALKNNEFPLMLRVTKDRKRKYKSIGVSTKIENWDFVRNQPKPNTPNRDLILKIIADKIAEYRETVLELKSQNKEFSVTTLAEKVSNPKTQPTVKEFIQKHIDQLKAANRLTYAASVTQLFNSLLKFNKHLDIYFPEIDLLWLKKYELWLRKANLKENTIGIRFRTFRMLYNSAIDQDFVKKESYPFHKMKIAKLKEQTAKRAITKQQFQKILNFQSDNPYTTLAIDIFAFSYYMGGINFVDIAYLTSSNILGNKLVYYRKKTKKRINLPLSQPALTIITKYSNPDSAYLFPILNHFHQSEVQKQNRVHKVISKVNKELKTIGKQLDLNINLTTYVARHTFATVLKTSGVPTSLICEVMGHSSEKITQIYLDSFDNEQVNEAMKKLM